MNFGERISKLRRSKKNTQKELASKLFVTDKTISSWESNRPEPNLEMIVKLSETLECSASYLIFGDNFKDNIEMEIKIKLTKEEFEKLNKYMKSVGTYLLHSNQQDIYYQSDYMDGDINKSIRLRLSGNKKILTYKTYNNNMYCEEYEVEIDNSNNLQKIFDFMGLKKVAEVKKERRVYSYQDKYAVFLDRVENLGYYLEIEVKGTIKDFYEEYDNLLKGCRYLGLNLNNIERKRYPELLLNKKLNGG